MKRESSAAPQRQLSFQDMTTCRSLYGRHQKVLVMVKSIIRLWMTRIFSRHKVKDSLCPI